ncbi:MAG: S8 family serine peptidase, partial [Nanoarchaeales archaeon]|nr:S8 family serine peptidase [Nanoarchaeales archaeon]
MRVNYTGKGVKVGVLDTGIDESHEFLEDTIVDSVSFIKGEDTSDYSGHGTHVAGIISGNNKYMSGVAPDSDIVNIKVLDRRGGGSTFTIVKGINYAIDNNVDIISISIGAPYSTPDRLIDEVIAKAINSGIVVVVASGNCGSGYCSNFYGVMVPGSSKDVITVGAVNNKMEHISFSAGQNFEGYLKPDVVAPGNDILSSIPNNKYLGKSGTSMATPHITGIIALLLEKNPELSHFEVKEILKNTAIDLGKTGKDVKYGYGFVKASDVLSFDEVIEVSEESSVSVTAVYDLEFDVDFLGYEFGGEFIISDIEIFDTYEHKLAKYSLFPDDFDPETDDFESFGVYGMSFESHEKFMYFIYQMLDVENDENNIEIINFDNNYLLKGRNYYWYNDKNQVFKLINDNIHSENIKKVLDSYSDFTGNIIGKTKQDNSQKQFSIQELVIEEDEQESLKKISNSDKNLDNFVKQAGSYTKWGSNFNPGSWLSFGESERESFISEGEDNWYSIDEEDKPAEYVFEIINIDRGDDIDLYVYDENKNRQYSSQRGSNKNEKVTLLRNNFKDKKYYLNAYTYDISGLWASATIKLSKQCVKKEVPDSEFCRSEQIYTRFYEKSCNTNYIQKQRDCSDLDWTFKGKLICDPNDNQKVLRTIVKYEGSCSGSDTYCTIDFNQNVKKTYKTYDKCDGDDICSDGACKNNPKNDNVGVGGGGSWSGGGGNPPPEPPITDCRIKASLCSSSQFCGQQDGNCYAKVDKCDGGFSVETLDNRDRPVSEVIIKLLGTEIGDTDSSGYLKKDIYSTSCNYKQTVTATCKDVTATCKPINNNAKNGFSFTEDGDLVNLRFDCSVCEPEKDLSVDLELITFNDKKTEVCVRQTGYNGKSVNIKVYHQDKEQNSIVKTREYVTQKTLNSYEDNCVTFNLDSPKESDLLHVWVDPGNRYVEDYGNEYNNYVLKPYDREIKVFVDVDMDKYSILDDIIIQYIDTFSEIAESKSDADMILKVDILKNENVFYDFDTEWESTIEFSGFEDNIPVIEVYSKYLVGTIAGLKKLVNDRSRYFDLDFYDKTVYWHSPDAFKNKVYKRISKFHTDSLGVRDLIGLSRDAKNDNSLYSKIENVLFDNNYELEVHKVKTLDSTSYGKETYLRIKNLRSDYSEEFKNALKVNDTPVVMAGGVFSGLESLSKFGNSLIKDGYDVWLLELTGGPETECDSCPDYTFDDVAQKYFPASLAGVLKYSGKDKVNYVGHSNGGRSALAGLNIFSKTGLDKAGEVLNYETGIWEDVGLPIKPVSKFFGIGVPSVLNDETAFTYLNSNYGNKVSNLIRNRKHLELSEYGSQLIGYYLLDPSNYILNPVKKSVLLLSPFLVGGLLVSDEYKLSNSMVNFYINLSKEQTSTFDLSNVDVDKLYLFNTNPDDLIVPYSDAEYIYNAATGISDGDKDI